MTIETLLYTSFFSILGIVFVIGIAAAVGFGPALRLLHSVVDVQASEVRAMLVGALYFFCILTAYGILRPIRDAMAVAGGTRNLPWLFAATLTAMVLFHPVYSSLVARFPVRRFVSLTYGFFASCLVVFFFLLNSKIDEVDTGRAFFIWTSIFALFNTSIFWSVMVDTFHTSQARRLFGFIAIGGTVGFITGAAITAFFVQKVGNSNLLLVSTSLLIVASILVATFPRVPQIVDGVEVEATQKHQDKLIGGSVWSGILAVTRSRYIAGIAGFLILYTVGSTVLYSAQTDIIGKAYATRELQTAVLARMDLITQIIAGLGQAFLTARLIRSFGLAFTLSAVAIVSIIGFAALGLSPVLGTSLLWTFLIFNVARRASDFMLSNPSRKILFTVLSREDKYKASSFLETSVYRLGDQLAVWGYAGLIALGLVLANIAWIAVALSVLFLMLSLWLARRQRELAARAAQPAPVQAAA